MREFVISLRRGKTLKDLPVSAGSLEDFLTREKIAVTTVMPTGTTIVVRLSDIDRSRFQERYGNTMNVVERAVGHVL
jgi:hypothetical protein